MVAGETGDVLVAGGDVGGKLGGAINLATSTNSSASAQIFDGSTNLFDLVGALNTKRESAAIVALPNGKTLVVGGESCSGPMTFGGVPGFECDALQTAELYDEGTQSFTFTNGMMTIARSGPSATLISGSGTALDGQVLIVGGSTGSSFLGTSVPPPGSGAPTGQTALNTAELYNPSTDSFTQTGTLPACAAGTFPPTCTNGVASICGGPTSSIMSASETGTTATITMATANPTGLTMGDGVTINNVTGTTTAGYNGSFVVTAIPTSTTFQFTTVAGLTSGSGGTAASDTFECGMVDQGAALIPNDSGKVLVSGGDILTFLGQSSNTSFIFDPSTQTFSRTSGSMAFPRELFPMVGITSGTLAGDVVAFGGINANSAVCLATPSTPVVATTNQTAEVFNPGSGTWSATANMMGVKRTTTVTLINAGTLTGQVILPGGVDVEAGTFPSTCAATLSLKQVAQSEVDLYDPNIGTNGTFAATGALNQAREGQGQGVIGKGTDDTDVLVIGGACTVPSPGSLQSVVIGTSQAATTCQSQNAGAPPTGFYSELYSQSTNTWTKGPAFATGFAPTNGAASTVLP